MSISRKLILLFFSVMIFGALLLYMPFALQEGKKISFLTAIFTISSATCVTGLTLIDIREVLSFKGQLILILFVQLGGLGIMTLSSVVILLVGKKISYKGRYLIKEERNAENSGEIVNFIKRILLIVISIEGIGAILLTFEFLKTYSYKRAIYYGIFHSISAFCNAGFSLFPDSFELYSGNVLVNLTMSFLIIFGGIGFAVINSVIIGIMSDRRKFTLTSKVSILVSIILLIGGMILFFILEYKNETTLANLGLFDKILASFFQSAAIRTSGFYTVSMETLRPATIFMFYVLMFIGGSPGSTGGGIKTTTVGVIILYVISVIKGEENVNIFNRRVSWEILNRALAILVISITYVIVMTMIIMTVEDGLDFNKIIFEVISAFSTTGLSLGVTDKLGVVSQIFIIITMFIGRLGPMTFALAIGEQKRTKGLRYPKENILIG